MLINSLFAYLHFLAAFGIFATLFYEWLTFNKNLTYAEARKIQKCDLWYGILAGVILVVGFLRVVYFEKGSGFYFSSPFFLIKLGLFLAVGLISIYPTMKFIAWRKDTRQDKSPTISEQDFSRISLVLNVEMIMLIALILSASLMARGILH
jgi:putative membrane protein